MNSATMQLILALIPIAEELIFNVGGQMVKIATADLNTPEEVQQALADAKTEGFPQLSFLPINPAASAESAAPVQAEVTAAPDAPLPEAG